MYFQSVSEILIQIYDVRILVKFSILSASLLLSILRELGDMERGR